MLISYVLIFNLPLFIILLIFCEKNDKVNKSYIVMLEKNFVLLMRNFW